MTPPIELVVDGWSHRRSNTKPAYSRTADHRDRGRGDHDERGARTDPSADRHRDGHADGRRRRAAASGCGCRTPAPRTLRPAMPRSDRRRVAESEQREQRGEEQHGDERLRPDELGGEQRGRARARRCRPRSPPVHGPRVVSRRTSITSRNAATPPSTALSAERGVEHGHRVVGEPVHRREHGGVSRLPRAVVVHGPRHAATDEPRHRQLRRLVGPERELVATTRHQQTNDRHADGGQRCRRRPRGTVAEPGVGVVGHLSVNRSRGIGLHGENRTRSTEPSPVAGSPLAGSPFAGSPGAGSPGRR